MRPFLLLLLLCLGCPFSLSVPGITITVGSKNHTESYVLAEVIKRRLAAEGFETCDRLGLGGTMIAWSALVNGSIDIYPEYTGTIENVILKSPKRLTFDEIRLALAKRGLGMSDPLGYNNRYSLGMKRSKAKRLDIQTISDLRKHPQLRYGFSAEFVKRLDGWKVLHKHYELPNANVKGMDRSIVFQALKAGQIDVIDSFATDQEIAELDLVELQDDLYFFPQYFAVYLYRLNLPPKVAQVLKSLAGTIDQKRMTSLNEIAVRNRDYAYAASFYPGDIEELKKPKRDAVSFVSKKVLGWTIQHLVLVGLSLLLAVVVGIPFGILAMRSAFFNKLILGFSGIIQTIPAVALLALLVPIPLFGISSKTAIFVLFLYSLFPIIRNTITGLEAIPSHLREAAITLGLEPSAQLRKIYLPLASRTILTGVKTSAVINVGYATLAALIGAGGLGEPIITGLALNDAPIIFQGAIPAALLAVFVQGLFEILDRLVIPRGLRISNQQQTA